MSSALGPLNLSDADLKGFEALDPGRYNAEVFEITMDATKNEGKTPIGTPLMKVQFKLTDEEVDNRRVFTQYVIPPANHDAKKRAVMNGMIARFFLAIGEDEKKVTSKSYDPDFDELKGRACVVTLSKEEYPQGSGEYQNRVKGVKAAGSDTGSGSLL